MPRAGGKGRVAAFEIMVGTPAVANLIRENNTHQLPGVLQTHSKDGMCTLDQSLAERYAEGLIKREEAFDRAQDIKELMKMTQATDQKRAYAVR
jgi:twitching motility protein PilT